jgi:hypothetical protein
LLELERLQTRDQAFVLALRNSAPALIASARLAAERGERIAQLEKELAAERAKLAQLLEALGSAVDFDAALRWPELQRAKLEREREKVARLEASLVTRERTSAPGGATLPKLADDEAAVRMFNEWQRRCLEDGERPERAEDWPEEVAFYRRHLEKARAEGYEHGRAASFPAILADLTAARERTERERDEARASLVGTATGLADDDT